MKSMSTKFLMTSCLILDKIQGLTTNLNTVLFMAMLIVIIQGFPLALANARVKTEGRVEIRRSLARFSEWNFDIQEIHQNIIYTV